MRSVYVHQQDPDSPLTGLGIGELDLPTAPTGWIPVTVTAAALNHHDLWSLRGVGLSAERLPMVLGTDAAGTDPEGNPVIIHSVIASPEWHGEETLDPRRTLLSELHPGTFAEQVWVPRRNLIAKPDWLTWAEAAALPTAYLTAFRMLTHAAQVEPGHRVLIQGASGGVATAAIQLARAMGAHVIATSRTEAKCAAALDRGAHEAVLTGTRVAPVDAVLETVGQATWDHSLRSLRPGGVIAIAGATSGATPSADLNRVFFRSLRIVGTTMGTRAEFTQLLGFLAATGVRPVIGHRASFADDAAIHSAFALLEQGAVSGKAVLEF